ncbi:immunodominant staphylococcal antigen IsaB family protein [Staphylococcus saprophyticus]|uniref:immunodominant staphylococcal antigen IsaB family protein n=1 Tax=Staphylococcus saprophyticus TaxID=29385 RepID=UPI003BF5FAA9
MNNKLLVFSSSVLATGVLLGASNGSGEDNTAHADTTNNNMNNMNQKDMSMNHNMDNMNGNMNQQAMMPYYNYTGYTTYDGDFTQDYDFVRALKHDNVLIDGYKVNTAAADKDVATSKKWMTQL